MLASTGTPGSDTPIRNTGVSDDFPDNSYAYSLDYFRYTVDFTLQLCDVLPPVPAFDRSERELIPLPWYTNSVALECGRIDYNMLKPEMKKLVTLYGQDLERARGMGVDERTLVSFAQRLPGFHCTRVDLTCDVKGGDYCDPHQILQAFIAGACKTKARTANRVDNWQPGSRGGCTIYIGSRDSLTFLRVYDKAAQLGGDTPVWTRIEVECKGDVANNVCAALAAHGVIEVTKEAIRRYIRTGVQWFDDAAHSDTPGTLIAPGEHRQGDFEVWINTACLPAIARAVRERIPGVREALAHILNS